MRMASCSSLPVSRSYIAPHEREEAQLLIESSLHFKAFPDLRPDHIMVKLFAREEEIVKMTDAAGRDVKFIIPPSMRCHDAAHTHRALVIARGCSCSEDSVQVGDFVLIPRHEGVEVMWEKTVVRFLPESAVYGVVQSPRLVRMEERSL